jgi:dUTP pyrophosphatase
MICTGSACSSSFLPNLFVLTRYSAENTAIVARSQALVATDISIAVPAGTYGRVAPRSGLAVKHGIDTGAGVIDADYRGPVKVVLFNLSDKDFEIKEGDRIAQLILERIASPSVVVVKELSETARGQGGFGSTGGFGVVVPAENAVAGAAANGTAPSA